MTAGANAVEGGKQLVNRVVAVARRLDLEVRREFHLGQRFWGAKRRIDILLTHRLTRERVGIECKYQGARGSAEEKVFTTLKDIQSWPMRGLVVLDGNGFSDAMRNSFIGPGTAVDFDDLEVWLRIFFKLDLPERT